MFRQLLTLALASTLAGCFVYEERLVYRGDHAEAPTEEPGLDPRRPNHPDDAPPADGGDNGSTDDTDADAAPVQSPYFLSPSVVALGQTVIVSVRIDTSIAGGTSLSTLESVTFFGTTPAEVLATSPRSANEFLITLHVPSDGMTGTQDVLLEWADGKRVLVEGAFLVVATPSEIPADQLPGAGSPGGDGDGDGDGCGCPCCN